MNERVSILSCLKDNTVITRNNYITLRKNGYFLLITPETGAWATVSFSDKYILDFIETPKTIKCLKDFQHKNTSDIIDLLFYSGLIQVNGKDVFMIKPSEQQISLDNSLPLFWVLKYTNACNLRCQYCYSYDKNEKNRKNLPNEFIYKIPELIGETNCDNKLCLCFHGGEPLLRYNDIVECVTNLRNKWDDRIEFNIQTNGTLMNYEIAKFLKDSKFTVGISVDGYDEKTNRLRTYANYKSSINRTIKAIKYCQDLGLRPGIISVMTNNIYNKTIEIIENFSILGIKEFHFNHFFPSGRGENKVKDFSISTEQILKTRVEMLLFINDYNSTRERDEHISERYTSNIIKRLIKSDSLSYMCSQSPCGAGRRILTLNHDGNIYPCDDLGNIPLFRIDHITSITDLRKTLAKSKAVHTCQSHCIDNIPKCRECLYKRLCISHCCSDSYHYTGKFNSPHSACDFIKLFIPTVIDLIHKGRIKVENLID